MEEISDNDKLSFDGNDRRLRFNTSGRITTKPGDFIFCPNGTNENNKAKKYTVYIVIFLSFTTLS